MRTGRVGLGLGLALALALAVPAQAQSIQNLLLRNSFNPSGAGARGLGMGGAFIAVADDGTAAAFNPAGLAQLRRTEFAVVGFGEQLTSTVVAPRFDGPETITDTASHGALDFVGLAIPFEAGGRNLTLQLSYQRAVDLFGGGRATLIDTVDLGDFDPDLSGTGEVVSSVAPQQTGAFHTASLSGAYQLSSHLSLGLGANYWIADWDATGTASQSLRVRQPEVGEPMEIPLFANQFDQAQSLRGFNFNVGLLLKYSWLSLGAVVRSPFTGSYDLDENDIETSYDSETGEPLDDVPQSYAVRSQLHFSRSIGFGMALRPFRGVTLAADYSRSEWSRTFVTNVPGGALLTEELTDDEGNVVDTFTDRNFFDLLPASVTSTPDTSSWRAGGEYLLVLPKLIIPLRAGYFRDRSPITGLAGGEGRLIEGWTVGTGLNFSRFVLDVAFERRDSDGVLSLHLDRDESGVTQGQATEEVRQERIVVSFIYRFGGDDPFRRLFGKLLGDPKDEPDDGPADETR